MAAALDDFVVLGIHTTIGFLKDIIDHPEFRAGRTNTAFIKNFFEGWKEGGKSEDHLRLALAAAAFDDMAAEARPGADSAREAKRGRRRALEDVGPVEDRRSAGLMEFEFLVDGALRKISLEKKDKTYVIRDGEAILEAEIRRVSENELMFLSGGRSSSGLSRPGREANARFCGGPQFVIGEPRHEAGRFSAGRGGRPRGAGRSKRRCRARSSS